MNQKLIEEYKKETSKTIDEIRKISNKDWRNYIEWLELKIHKKEKERFCTLNPNFQRYLVEQGQTHCPQCNKKLNKMNKGKLIDVDKLKGALLYKKKSIDLCELNDLINELSEEREEQPTPLKVAIKGDGTEEYSKAIFQYFGKHTIKGQHDIGSFVCEVYYYIENDNIVFCPFLPKGYTEVSLKEGEKAVTDNSKVNTYLLNRVEELEKELIDLKLKLKELSK